MLAATIQTSHHRTAQSQTKLSHSVIVRAPGLLPMLYTIAELSEDLGMSDRTLREWLATGAPKTTDERGRVWVNGIEFAKWVETQRTSKAKEKLADDEARCLHCKKAVKLIDTQIIEKQGKLIIIQGRCPECGCKINRGGRRG